MPQPDPAIRPRPGAHLQYAALCWRLKAGRVEVLLITSRETGRWLIPRGWPMAGHSPPETARIEAWEEAGACGTAGPDCIGVYSYAKGRAPESLRLCQVQVYPLAVSRLAKTFPEQHQRRRKWFTPRKAARKVANEGLAALLDRFDPFASPLERATPLETAPPEGHFRISPGTESAHDPL